MSRWKAFTIHLLISALIALVFLIVCRFYWFQGPLFHVTGGAGLLSILVPVDVILGPLLTLLVFKSGKPTLKMDLTVIGLIQCAALIYGAIIMIQARPLYVVLYHEELRVVRPLDLVEVPWKRAVVSPTQYVRVSSDIGALADIEEQVSAYTGATPPHLNPDNYQPLEVHESEFKDALSYTSTAKLKAFDDRYVALLDSLPSAPVGYGVIPMIARGARHLGVFDRETLELVEVLQAENVQP
ncbi:hypothetical protein [Permianibacter aggregans]|uniref:Pilus assembly protein n=1 Tax=Permianibacter aggregans TaxID=1510150 RepID=A0A4R6UH86_9GAMM|nr:hypothetical protein [Permianibacter aggregans]QGX39013.1 hypothetical protein E2H98_04790 [Permianibacter aggregans]TDQ44649.1 hypothetical protein EV696_12352 [Permianibacter aggregans]